LPDSTPVAIASLLPKPVDDSMHGRAAGRDTTAADTLETRDSLSPGKKPAPGPTPRPQRSQLLTSRPPLFDRLTLRVPRPWAPGSRLVLEIRGVRNVTGIAGTAVGVVAVPEKSRATPQDTTKKRAARDTTHKPQAHPPAQPPPARPK